MLGVDIHFRNWITNILSHSKKTPLIFVSGAQGIGKSTAMKAISNAFEDKIAILGIDDFYLTKKERHELANTVSPLFETRGPPGTHDLELLKRTINALKTADETSTTTIPRFDKKTDDRVTIDNFQRYTGTPKIIIVEGWLIGADAARPNEDWSPLNSVEKLPLADEWQAYQNEQLAGPYRNLWDLSPYFFHMNAPSFNAVLNWRVEQEETTLGLEKGKLSSERKEWVSNFIQYYERITRRMLNGEKRAGAQLYVDENRKVIKFENAVVNND